MEINNKRKIQLLSQVKINPEKPLSIICRGIVDYSYGCKQLKHLSKEGYIKMKEKDNYIYAELTKKGQQELNNIPLEIL